MIKFGPSGNSIAFIASGNKSTEQAADWVKNLELDCFEYSFGRGVRMSEKTAESIARAFKMSDVEISVHAPYYINFANIDDDMAEKSFGYLLDSAKKCRAMGGHRVVFHPACQGKATREEAVALTKKRLQILCDKIYDNALDDMLFCPETMGKIAQIGTVEEIADFCSIDKVFVPCIDFGHINAREHGSLKTEKDYADRLEYLIDKLGYERMKNFHMHFSKIEYSAGGEVKHLTFEEDKKFGPKFTPLAIVLKKLKLEPYVVCESAGTQDLDALLMKKIYFDEKEKAEKAISKFFGENLTIDI